MATQTQQRTAKRNQNNGKGTVLVFKLLAFLAACLGLIIGAVATVTSLLPTHDTTQGTVIAYYENDYQRYAIERLTESDRLEQWPCLYDMWQKESNWRPLALNKSSGASGIAQLMPLTWKLVKFKQTTDGYRQVDAGLVYIDRHYGKNGGNICRAYAHHLAKGWY
jgi:hypothetical protein